MKFEQPSSSKEIIKTKKENINWPKIKKYTRLLALSALLTISSLSTVSAQESNKTQSKEFNMEQLITKASQETKKVCELILKNSILVGTINGDKSREWDLIDKGERVQVGYKADGITPKWIIYENSNGAKLYFDDNADGSIDKVIINNEIKKENTSQIDKDAQRASSELDAFDSMESLAETANIKASMKPEDITIAKINFKDGHSTLRIVDFKSGESGEITSEHGDEIAESIQASYVNHLKSVITQMNK